MDIPCNNISAKELVVIKLKEMIDHVSISDRCTICEAIHQLEQPDNNFNGSLWMMLIFAMIFGGFGGDNLNIDTISKVFNDYISKEKEEETK